MSHIQKILSTCNKCHIENDYGGHIMCFIQSDLLNDITLKGDILGSSVRKCHWGDAGQSLCLMDDSVGEVQVLPVLDLHLTTSYLPAHLFLDLVWKMKSFCFNENNLLT